MVEAGRAPVRQSVGMALRFAVENWPFLATVSAIGAAATVLITAFSMAVPPAGFLASLAQGAVQAFVYATFVGAALYGAAAARSRWSRDGGRVWMAMLIVFFFLFIVFTVLTIPVMITLFAGPFGRYATELQGAGDDQQAVMAIMVRAVEENPAVILFVFLLYTGIWLLLTSRLYLAAPATVDQGRVLVFDTWKWTKGAMLRIAGARLLLLFPANVLAGALGYLVGRVVGIDTLDMASLAQAAPNNPTGVLIYSGVSGFITLMLYSTLEAGLSSYLYQSLKPAPVDPQRAAA